MEGQSSSDNSQADSESCDKKTRLGVCEVCGFRDALYTCPRCEVKTCSLRCNKIHKIEIECNGERDRTKYIPLKKFSNLDLSSDYRLMEEISRSVETMRKNFGKKMKYDIPFSLIKLRNGAAARKTILKFLPFAFERHKKNSTTFDAKKNLIYWHIDWVFLNADSLRISDSEVPEVEKMSVIVGKYLKEQEDLLWQEKLQFYQSVGHSGIRLLLKAERKKGRKFYELDQTMTLKDCLRSRTIIEYPTIYVLLKSHADSFEIVDSDCEEDYEIDKEIKNGSSVVNNIIKHADSSESIYNALKNLLFVSDNSEEEIID